MDMGQLIGSLTDREGDLGRADLSRTGGLTIGCAPEVAGGVEVETLQVDDLDRGFFPAGHVATVQPALLADHGGLLAADVEGEAVVAADVAVQPDAGEPDLTLVR